jgi:hypothetical protein
MMRLFMCVLWALSGMVENGWYLEIARVITTTVKNVKISANAKTNYTHRETDVGRRVHQLYTATPLTDG